MLPSFQTKLLVHAYRNDHIQLTFAKELTVFVNYFTDTDSDARYYTQTESDDKYDLIVNVYNKTDSNGR